MLLVVLCFALCENAFTIRDVKIGTNGKPRGNNGFLLSKLPIVELDEESNIKKKLSYILNYLLSALDIKDRDDKSISYCRMGVTETCIISVKLHDFADMNIELANTELSKLLKFYQRHLPKELKGYCESITGKVEKNGMSVIQISKSMVLEGSKI